MTAHNRPPERMTYEDKRTTFASFCQGVVELKIKLRKRAGLRARVTPRIACPIVCADAGEPRDLGLNKYPIEGKIAQTILYDHRRRAFARAEEMQFMAAKVDQSSGSGRRLCDRKGNAG